MAAASGGQADEGAGDHHPASGLNPGQAKFVIGYLWPEKGWTSSQILHGHEACATGPGIFPDVGMADAAGAVLAGYFHLKNGMTRSRPAAMVDS